MYEAGTINDVMAITDQVRDGDAIWSRLGPYPYPTTAQQIVVTSTHPDDTVGGAGARQIEIRGVLDDGAYHAESVQLNGQTSVLSSAALLRCPLAYVQATGAGGRNLGTITLESAGTVLSEILPGKFRTFTGVLAVPSRWRTRLVGWSAALRENRNTSVELVVRWRGNYGRGDDPWVTYDAGEMNRFQPVVSFPGIEDELPPMSDVEWRVVEATTVNRGVALFARWDWSG